jgi:hypothetical protein
MEKKSAVQWSPLGWRNPGLPHNEFSLRQFAFCPISGKIKIPTISSILPPWEMKFENTGVHKNTFPIVIKPWTSGAASASKNCPDAEMPGALVCNSGQ